MVTTTSESEMASGSFGLFDPWYLITFTPSSKCLYA